MAQLTFKGTPVHTNAELPAVGSAAPDFTLTTDALADVSLADFAGRKKLLNIVPSLDTRICAISARRFNEAAAERPEAVFVNISADLPFAQKRFCEGEGLDNVRSLSMMRSRAFARDYGVLLEDGPLAGLSARAVVVIDRHDRVVHAELVPEIAQEPDYQRALAALDAAD